MSRIFIIRAWLRRELAEAAGKDGAYEDLLRELLAVIDRNTITFPSYAQSDVHESNEARHCS